MSSEQAVLFSTVSSQTRCASVLVPEAGLRSESVGNYDGTDGLTLCDLPELRILNDDSKQSEVTFTKIPTTVVVRESSARQDTSTLPFFLQRDSNSSQKKDLTLGGGESGGTSIRTGSKS